MPSFLSALARLAWPAAVVLAVAAPPAASAQGSCGDPISALSSLSLSAFVGGSPFPLPLPFVPTTCDYKLQVPPSVHNLITVHALPASISAWGAAGQVHALHVNGETIQCYAGTGKCDTRSVIPDEPMTVLVEVWNSTAGGQPDWSSEYTITPSTLGTPPVVA